MAGWSEKFNKMTQSAISKSKEMAEVTKLNMEISTLMQNLKEVQIQVGAYVLENGLLTEDEKIGEWAQKAASINVNIEANQVKVQDIRNINICSNCGAEVSRSSKFCDKCGNEMVRTALGTVTEGKVCKVCGAPVEEGSAFCGNCGTKQD